MTAPYEPLTPAQVESRLSSARTAITKAQSELKDARIAEAKALDAYERAKVTAAYADDCPAPDRKTGVTVGDRDIFLSRATRAETEELRHKTVLKEIALDALRARIEESRNIQSECASVRQAYQMAGVA